MTAAALDISVERVERNLAMARGPHLLVLRLCKTKARTRRAGWCEECEAEAARAQASARDHSDPG